VAWIAAFLFPYQGTEAQLTRRTPAGTCTSDLDCVLLGSCVQGKCVCDPGYTGPNCQLFDLLPSRVATIEGFDNPAYPAWGGKSIYANGQWHWVGSYIRNRCDIWDYNTNSAFLRATADHPMGPFTFQNEVLPPFHHGAQLERGIDGKYLIFGDGRNMPESTVRKNCAVVGNGGRRREASPEAIAAGFDEDVTRRRRLQETEADSSRNLYPRGNSPNDVHMVAMADSMSGPWTQHWFKELQTDLTAFSKWNCNKTNLAPLLMKNGTVMIAFRSKSCVDMQKQIKEICGMECQKIGMAVSHNGLKGPFHVRPRQLEGLDGNEDPFLWQTKRGFHLVFHGKIVCGASQAAINTCGTYAYSPDSYTWYMSPFPIYEGRVWFHPSTGRTSEVLEYRHRPKILFSNEGVPMVLYTSGKRFSNPYVRNFAFAFNVEEMRNYKEPPKCPPKNFVNACTTHTRRNIVYNRTEPGCQMMGTHNCIWCESKGLCMPGTDADICKASSPETFWAHC